MLQLRHHLGLGEFPQLFGCRRQARQLAQSGLPGAADAVPPLRDGRGLDGARRDARETARITALLSEAVAAGALGFSTTTGRQHVGYKGRPLACRLANREELSSYAHALGKLGKGVIEITLTQDFGNIADHEYELLDFLLDESSTAA